ncbi:uncharacterized protein A1O5_10772 [Cladophialophora psammophila CBS 110553]|uniref:AB hydrolase-1 domain-containing protein n=1 Tax=Cladophialophora psammophila CBS 110553 TaxID=1182543 RepID=W9WNB4_9EURO|nr:uncharacterized protein A1O5_10772 [Cladophialophora psammophila CBS 110553]EXJ66156.1 hypothetical protein A1O5_10772 [Cladophialophora psammophila CBS 110553]
MAQSPDPHSQFITHPTGQTTHIIVDDFTDPWKPSETILIQSGFARHAAFWYHWVPALSRRYRVVRRDLRGHGRSSCPDPGSGYDYSLDTILGEILDTLDQLNIPKVHFLGESTAGMIAVAFAAKHPDRLLSLTTCATPTHLPMSAQKEWALGYKDWETACRTLGSKAYCSALSKMPGGIGQPDPEYTKWWLEQIGLNSGEGLAQYAKFLSTLEIRSFYEDITKSQLPVLILAPTRSRNTNFQDQQKQRDFLKGCTFEAVDGAGHEIFVDKAQQCQDAVLKFLGNIRAEGFKH